MSKEFDEFMESISKKNDNVEDVFYTEGQLLLAMSKAREMNKLLDFKYTFYEIIQSLKQPK